MRDGYANVIVISMGPIGAWLVTEEEQYFVASPPVEKKSTVGAGDSMVAGITYSLQKGKKLPLANLKFYSYEIESGQSSFDIATNVRLESIVDSTSIDFVEERSVR